MTREEKEQTGKYVLQMARLLEDGCYQQEMLLKAVRIIDEALEQDSCEDCISREQAIKALQMFPHFNPIELIRKQPSVQPARIPDKATNGDVIKAMFPNAEIGYGLRGVVAVTFIHKTIFDLDWWNAPYKDNK